MGEAAGRVFLFLQGPQGPFFHRLARTLTVAGAGVLRVSFNRADEAEWGAAGPLLRFTGGPGAYRVWLARVIATGRVTDIVLYGEARPEHAQAIRVARERGVTCHRFEEGYLRPHWVTYERKGTNGNSPLCTIPTIRIANALGGVPAPADEPEDGWGHPRLHLYHAARYHARLLLPSLVYGRCLCRAARWPQLQRDHGGADAGPALRRDPRERGRGRRDPDR